jgi:hypothetical protein
MVPANALDAILLARVFQGTADSVVLEDFTEQLLHHWGRLPEPKFALGMDNGMSL